MEEFHGLTLRSYESVLFERLYAKSGGTLCPAFADARPISKKPWLAVLPFLFAGR